MCNVCLTKENLASHLHGRMMPLTEVRLDLKAAPRIYSGAPVLLGVIRIGAKGGSGGSSNLELYTTQPSSSLSPRRTTGNRVVVLLLVLLWPRGKKKKPTYCTKSWTSFTSTPVCISCRERGQLLAHLVF